MLLHGVDFSGADGGGLAKIRVVTRNLAQPREPLRFEGRFDRAGLLRLIRAGADPGSGTAAIWRIDAPFGLPLESLGEHGLPTGGPDAWIAMARWMAAFGSPRAWRGAMRETSRREPKRICDRCFRTPMAPMNLRVFKQTWTLVCEVLLPLAEAGVRIEPLRLGRAAGHISVCEGCPASVLAAMNLSPRGYKGAGDPPRRRRSDILAALTKAGLGIPSALRAQAVEDEEGDLLDAILLVSDPFQLVPPAEAAVEGWVY